MERSTFILDRRGLAIVVDLMERSTFIVDRRGLQRQTSTKPAKGYSSSPCVIPARLGFAST
jgi:hypothetical protein